MKISEPDSLTVTHQRQGWGLATGNVVVGEEGGLTRAYFELRIDSGNSDYEYLGNFFIGAVREGLDHDKHHGSSNNAWLIDMADGSLHGNGKHERDNQFSAATSAGQAPSCHTDNTQHVWTY